MRDAPGVPITMETLPSRVRIVGVMDDSGRFPGAMALKSPPTTPVPLGTPAFAAKSSISSFKRNPAPSTTTPDPNHPFNVYVLETAFPHRSRIEKWVV